MEILEALRALQQRRVVHPNAVGFSPEEWRAFFSSSASEDVLLLCEFGLELYAEMQHVRNALGAAVGEFPAHSNRAHQCVVEANAMVFSVLEQQSQGDGTAEFADFAAAAELTGVKMNLRPTMNALVEAVYDALRLPIAYFAEDAAPSSGRRARRVHEFPLHARQVNSLAGAYGTYEYLWGLVVWRQWRITKVKDCFYLRPSEGGVADAVAVAQHINNAEKAQTGVRLVSYWQTLPSEVRAALTPPVARLSVRDGRLAIRWDWEARHIATPSVDLMSTWLLKDRGLAAVLGLCFAAEGVSAEEALQFRSLLREIGFGIERQLRTGERRSQIDFLSATVDKGQLCRICREVLNWPVEKVVKCIDLHHAGRTVRGVVSASD